jgi:excisionase family DNA binding protein
MDEETRDWLTVNEVAKQLDISDWHVRRAIERGELKALHFGPRTYHIFQVDVDAWVELRKQLPAGKK